MPIDFVTFFLFNYITNYIEKRTITNAVSKIIDFKYFSITQKTLHIFDSKVCQSDQSKHVVEGAAKGWGRGNQSQTRALQCGQGQILPDASVVVEWGARVWHGAPWRSDAAASCARSCGVWAAPEGSWYEQWAAVCELLPAVRHPLQGYYWGEKAAQATC